MRPDFIRHQDAGADRMGDDQEGYVRRRVVGAVAAKRFAADLAGVDDPEIGTEQAAAAAGRTAAEEAAHHRLFQRAVRRGRRNTPNAGHVVHRRLPMRIGLRGAGAPRFRTPRDSEAGRTISNLSAPANGAASTRRTLTSPPSRNVSFVRAPTIARFASSKRK